LSRRDVTPPIPRIDSLSGFPRTIVGVRAPPGLSKPARRAWREASETLELVGRDPAEHRGRLRIYATAAGRLEELEQAWRATGAPMSSTGSRGQEVVNPALGELRELERHVADLADRLFGVPPARMGGWTLGRARSADRQARGPARRRSSKVVPLPLAVRKALDG
jgi:phage terminase small subunit